MLGKVNLCYIVIEIPNTQKKVNSLKTLKSNKMNEKIC